jgi:methylenetetrahydrofolate--tRNA-(uracil-5-)-methyltransferase
MKPIVIIGAGLAGCEAAWQIAKRGGKVVLYEMKPRVYSPAHCCPDLAEIVCSNSLKSESLENGHGLLKAEMEILDSLILQAARQNRVPAGASLAVDRGLFSREVTRVLEGMPAVEILREEVISIPPEGITVVASGPLTSEALSATIRDLTGDEGLFFYDAISPVVTADSIEIDKTFRASRYGKGGDDYINCPLNREEYDGLVDALNEAERVEVRHFERKHLFEGCLPVEEMAQRGHDTLAYGPLKPVGLIDPRTGRQPFAAVQLRQENRCGTLFSLVGFQTRLKYEDQKRVFRMIPGLGRAEFARLGSMHRNTFLDSPRLLDETLQLRRERRILFAGQITGVEGYMESAAMGLLSGINACRLSQGENGIFPPSETLIGALARHIAHAPGLLFQPMNANFGLLPALPGKVKKRERRRLLASRALERMRLWKEEMKI